MTEERKRRIPNAVTAARIPLSLSLLLVPADSAAFWCLYLLCGVSDVLDGFLARRWRVSSARGAAFDSAADGVFAVVWMLVMLPIIDWNGWIVGWIAIIALLRAGALYIGWKKYHALLPLHTWGNKATGLLLFAVPWLYRYLPSATIVFACLAATASAGEELLIQSTSTQPNRDQTHSTKK